MSDLETRLSAALSAGVAATPSTVGLAAAARQRLRRRRRTRGVVGGVLAVLLVAVPVGVVARDGSRGPDVTGPVETGDSWRTETWRGLSVDVPASWEHGDACDTDVPVVDESERPACRGGAYGLGVVFVDLTDTIFRSVLRPGEVMELDGRWTGYTYGSASRGPSAWVTAEDRDVVQRVLDSARPAALADGWRTETWGDIAVDVPADWATGPVCGSSGPPAVEVPEDGPGGAGPCGTRPMGLGARFFWSGLSDFVIPILEARGTAVQVDDDFPEGLFPDGAWIAWDGVDDDAVFVVTESREITQQVVDSVRAVDSSATDGWRVESWNGVSVDVPGGWVEGYRGTWCVEGGPRQGLVQRPGTPILRLACKEGPGTGFGVTFGPAAAFDPVYESGHVWRYEGGNVYVDGSWLGYWYDEDRLVQVNAGDRATVQRVLDSLQVSSDRQ